MQRWSALAIVVCCLASPVRAELPAVRVTDDAGRDDEPTAWGRRLAWTGVDPNGSDREVFWLDTEQPVSAGPRLPCPVSNPCQVSVNAVVDSDPQLSEQGVLWISRDLPPPWASLRFFDGAQHIAIPGAARVGDVLPSVSGPRVLWWGRDAAERPGIFLFDVTQPADAGEPVLCPGSNPCAVVLDDVELDWRSTPRLAGTRAVWADAPEGTGSDLEIVLFDAARAADAGPLASCPATNPCLVTSNDAADAEPSVSPERIAWLRCVEDCASDLPVAALIADDDETIEIAAEDDFGGPPVISGPWVTWSIGFWNSAVVFDARRAVALDPLGFPGECPTTNPCRLQGGSWTPWLVGSQLLLDTSSDVLGPFSLRLFDLERPLAEPPHGSCQEDGNPCVARDTANLGRVAYSGPLVAWIECDPGDFCFDDSAELYYALPEPDGGSAGAAALLGLAALAHFPKRSAPA